MKLGQVKEHILTGSTLVGVLTGILGTFCEVLLYHLKIIFKKTGSVIPSNLHAKMAMPDLNR